MALTSIGDLASSFSVRLRQADLKENLTRLGAEITEGRVSDPVKRLDGNLAYLSQIEHDLILAESFGTNVKEVAASAAAMQSILTRAGELSENMVSSLAITADGKGAADVDVSASQARGALESLVSALNTDVAGRHLLSGTSVETPPLAASDTILSELKSALGGATGPADVIALTESFFRSPGGSFETMIYRGSSQALTPIRLGAGESADLDLRANHPALRDTIMYTALAALADDPDLSLDRTGRRQLLGESLNGLATARTGQIALQADLGVTEARTERARARLETEKTTLGLARNELLAVDRFKVATEIEDVQTQLETLYAVTARNTRLSLVNFLS